MGECTNAMMKDLLPNHLHRRLTAAARVEVEAHLATCADCRAELALLARVAAVSINVRVDTARIVAALPSYVPTPAWRRVVQSPQFRMAAAIVLLAGGAGLVWNATRSRSAGVPDGTAQLPPDSTIVVKRVVVPPAPSPTPAPTRLAAGPVELEVGEALHDLTDSELRMLLNELEGLEAVTPAEVEVVVPAVTRGAS